VPLHMHLLETAYQKEYARRGEGTVVEYIGRFGLLGPQMTLGHGVWFNERDIQRLAENRNLCLSQLLIEFPAAFGCRCTKQARGGRDQ